MTYNKPEIVKLDSALSIIQGTAKGIYTTFDNLPNDGSRGAYESDE
jgi:hypothetical protein